MDFFMFSYTGVNYFQIITVHILKGKHHHQRRKLFNKNFGVAQAETRIASCQTIVINKPDLWLGNKVTLYKMIYSSNMTHRRER